MMNITRIDITEIDKDNFKLMISYNNGQKVHHISLSKVNLDMLKLAINGVHESE